MPKDFLQGFCYLICSVSIIVIRLTDEIIAVIMPSSKNLWCFNCNSVRVVCIHDECPEHCDMCTRIKEIASKSGVSY